MQPTENLLERFRLSGAIWGWSYVFPRPSPIVPCPSMGIEIGVILEGERAITFEDGREARFTTNTISIFNLGERYTTSFEPMNGRGREIGFVARLDRVAGWLGENVNVTIPNAGAISDPRLIDLARGVADAMDRGMELRTTELDLEVKSFVERHAIVEAGDALNRARLDMHRHFQKPLYMRHFAEIAGVHEATFARKFAARYGITPTRYRTLLRLKEAALLLGTRPDLSVRQIAAIVGFEDVPYFHRAFSAQFGTTPLGLGRRFSNATQSAA
jgi:AraC-like DNA-binding protein